MKVHLIHGIHSHPGSPELLIPYLVQAGLQVAYPDYGYELALETRLLNPMIQGALAPYIEPGDLLVGHSNGCAMAYELMAGGCPAIGAVFINGALETSWGLPGTCRWADVYYNQGDSITEVARLAEELGWVASAWGELGHLGYTGTDSRVANIDCGRTPDMPVVWGHSDFFTPSKLQAWGPYLAKRILEHLAHSPVTTGTPPPDPPGA